MTDPMTKPRQNPGSADVTLYRVAITLPEHVTTSEVGHIETVFSELMDSLATSHLRLADHRWLVEALFDGEPDRPVVLAMLGQPLGVLGLDDIEPEVGLLEQRDWLAENRASFPPLHIGRIWIHGSHVDQPAPAGSLPLLVEAAQAFGSGTHPTTEGCLRAMQMIAALSRPAPGQVLDMGCGSAILAMGARRIWPSSWVMAADNDPIAVRVAGANARLNGIAPQQMRCVVSAGFAGREVRRIGPYDMILANILAGPLRRMASDLVPHLAANGWLILSGILNEQAVGVERAYAARGLRCWAMLRIGDWTTIVMRPAAIGAMPRLWHGRQPAAMVSEEE